MNRCECVWLMVFSMVFSIASAQEKINLGQRKWILEPGVNCNSEDYRKVFGTANLMSFAQGFDEPWTKKEGNTQVSANAGGDLNSQGSTYLFAPTHGFAGVINHFKPDISAEMEVGLQADYKILLDYVDAASATPTQGGAYARNLFFLRVTDKNTGKVLQKFITNHGRFAGAFTMGESMDRSDTPLTFMLKPGHEYKLEAFIETKAAGYAEPNSTNTGSGENKMKVKLHSLSIVPKNPPWVSIWSVQYVPFAYDTYDRYERVLKRDHKDYFPGEFRFNVSAGGDYTQADSYVSLNCGQAQVLKVSGSLPGATVNGSRARFLIPQGGGEWETTVLLNTEVDPNKAPVTTLPAPLAQYWLTMEKSKVDTSNTRIEYLPQNWGIKVGDEVIPYEKWGTGAVAQAILEQNRQRKPSPLLDCQNLYFKNPKTGEVTPVSALVPKGTTMVKVPLGNPTVEVTPQSLATSLAKRAVLYSEQQSIAVLGHVANGGVQFSSDFREDLKYTAIFDFIPRNQTSVLEAR